MNLRQRLNEKLVMRKLWTVWRESIARATIPGSGGIVMLGDSLSHVARWELLFPHLHLRNFGISGERSEHLLQRLEPVFALKPQKVFILIGSNDLGSGRKPALIVRDVEELIVRLKAGLHGCDIVLQGLLPRQRKYAKKIQAVNAAFAGIALRRRIPYLDLYPLFEDGHGELRAELTFDRLHVNGDGYSIWRDALEPYMA